MRTNYSIVYRIGLSYLLLLCLFSGVQAGETTPANCGPADTHLVEESNWPPFTTQADQLATQGLSFDLMRLIFGHIGRCVQVRLFPMARVLEMARTGAGDGITMITITPERAAFLAFVSPPLVTRRGYIYYRSGRAAPILMKDWSDLTGLRVGIVRGRNYTESFQQARAQNLFSVTEVVTFSQLFAMLIHGRIDAVPAMDLEVSEYLVMPQYHEMIAASTQPYVEYNYHLAISRQSPVMALIPELGQAIVELQGSGEMAKVLAHYGM
jgi:polar amino acid transport system substrate-binding protein